MRIRHKKEDEKRGERRESREKERESREKERERPQRERTQRATTEKNSFLVTL